MKKFYWLLLPFLLIGGGCTSGSISIGGDDCENETSYGSCLEDGVDSALIGSWQLVSQSLETPAGNITNPFAGRTTTFANDRTYTEDYNTETTDDVNVLGLISTCDVTGLLEGDWEVLEGGELRITPDGGSPQVICQASGTAISSNASTAPLGVGPASAAEPYVVYSYTFNDDLTELTIVQENQYSGVTAISEFMRLN